MIHSLWKRELTVFKKKTVSSKSIVKISLRNPHRLIIGQNLLLFVNTVKPVSETTCINQPPDLRDHYSDKTPPLKSTK